MESNAVKAYNENEALRWTAQLRNGMSADQIDAEIRRAAESQGIVIEPEPVVAPAP